MTSVYKSANGRRQVRDWCASRIEAWEVAHRCWEVPTVAGITSVVSAGPDPVGGEPSVVLVPGTNMNAAVCLGMAKLLAARWHTVVLDVPGQPGLSADRRPRRRRTAWYGQWLAEALDRSVDGPALVVGHSLGGAIALACPSAQITGRVLVSTAGLVRLAVTPPVLAATVPWMARPTAARTERLLRRMVAPGAPVPDELTEWMTLVARCCRSSLAPMPLSSAVLAERSAATCRVVTGIHDVFLPPGRIGAASRLHLGVDPDVLDGVGHLVLDEQPASIVRLVEAVCLRHDR
jgi:pimeloyl-ACP methyl ester carboxylesterase